MLNRKSNACRELRKKQNNRLLKMVGLSIPRKQYCSTLHFTNLYRILLLFQNQYDIILSSCFQEKIPSSLCMSPDLKLGWTEERSRGSEKHTPKNTVVGPSSSRQSLLYSAKPKENYSCLATLKPASIQVSRASCSSHCLCNYHR